MNKNGFTLVELIAVIVLIALVALLVFPNLDNLKDQNIEKEYQTMEDMMVEYAKVLPNYQGRESGYICLHELNMNKTKSNQFCNGYVQVSQNKLTPYLTCRQGEKTLYSSNSNIEIPSDCKEV